jgi:hypothetical protein
MREFIVTYSVSVMESTLFQIPSDKKLPAGWDSLDLRQKDEWLYQNSVGVEQKWKDIIDGRAIDIAEVTNVESNT